MTLRSIAAWGPRGAEAFMAIRYPLHEGPGDSAEARGVSRSNGPHAAIERSGSEASSRLLGARTLCCAGTLGLGVQRAKLGTGCRSPSSPISLGV